jgi:hypothetical protein
LINDCKGLFGKLFGHKFEKYEIESKSLLHNISGNFTNEAMETLLKGTKEIKFEIRCKRCGCKANE